MHEKQMEMLLYNNQEEWKEMALFSLMGQGSFEIPSRNSRAEEDVFQIMVHIQSLIVMMEAVLKNNRGNQAKNAMYFNLIFM